MKRKCIAEAGLILGVVGFLSLLGITIGVVSLPSFTPDFVQDPMKIMLNDQSKEVLLAEASGTSERFVEEQSGICAEDVEKIKLQERTMTKLEKEEREYGRNNSSVSVMHNEWSYTKKKTIQSNSIGNVEVIFCIKVEHFNNFLKTDKEMIANDEFLDPLIKGDEFLNNNTSCTDQIKKRLIINIAKNQCMTKMIERRMEKRNITLKKSELVLLQLILCNLTDSKLGGMTLPPNAYCTTEKMQEVDLLEKNFYLGKSSPLLLTEQKMEISTNMLLVWKIYYLMKDISRVCNGSLSEYLVPTLLLILCRTISDIKRALEHHYQQPVFTVTKPYREKISCTYSYNQITFPNKELFSTYNKCLHKISILSSPVEGEIIALV